MFSQEQILLILIPAAPLAACLVTAAFGWAMRGRSHWPVILALGISFLCSLMLLRDMQVRCKQATSSSGQMGQNGRIGCEWTLPLWTWADVPEALDEAPRERMAFPDSAPVEVGTGGPLDFRVEVTLRADPLTCVMLAMVTFVSTLVAIYSAGYMHGEPGYARFFACIGLFVFSMTMLVSVSNFVMLYVFWEGVGLCSYFLIGFWYQKPEAAAASKKAFLVNRIGDVGFALALFLIWMTYGTLNFHDAHGVAGVLGQARLGLGVTGYATGGVATAICLLLLLGACGKSAQFPLHVWLPDAMEGPTPVSALIHAATMVTAGVYMIARCTPLFVAASIGDSADQFGAPQAVAVVGGFTALLAGLIAVTQTDLKRVLAYSTISQLGYMFLSLGTGSLLGIWAGMFHLFTHAFFKALLFLGAGSVMHAMGGVIDLRRFGGLKRLMPITRWTFLIGCLALGGIVPFAGFWSKDEILSAVHDRAVDSLLFTVLYWSAVFTAFLTAFYTFRAYFLTFHGKERVPPEAGHHAHESPWAMTGPLCVLAFCSVVVGWYFGAAERFSGFLTHTPSLEFLHLREASQNAPEAGSHMAIAILSTLIVLLGVALAAFFYLGDRRAIHWLTSCMKPAYILSSGKFFIDPIYQFLFVWPLRILAVVCYAIDRWLIDGLVNLIGAIPPAVSTLLRSLQSGMVQFYAMAMVLGVLVLVGALLMLT